MIEKVLMFTVICDNCKESAGVDAEYSCWADEGTAKEEAQNSGWINEKRNDYCPECYSYNDLDELTIDQSRKDKY